jgi:N-acetylmuramoyl-L-alanine amidase
MEEDFFSTRNEDLSRSSLRAAREAKRHRLRNAALMAVAVLLMGGIAAVVIAVVTMNDSGPKVPRLVGMKYADAKKKIESMGLFIEVDAMQDSSTDCSRLKIASQDPKQGTAVDKDDTVTVRLVGLHESAEYTGSKKLTDVKQDAGSSTPATQPQTPPSSTQTSAASGRTVCLDPGHSSRDGSEVDPATGLNVGDNGGASGELQAMWDLATRTRAKLEQAGYTVRLTKDSADSYASLRTRADIGNTCSLTVRLHYDDTGYTGVMRPPANAARCPTSDPSRISVVDGNVASSSDALARALAGPLGLEVKDDTGGTSQGNTTPAGHPTCLVGSVLSRVPVVCIENKMSLVRDNSAGQEQVASEIVAGINAYFQNH